MRLKVEACCRAESPISAVLSDRPRRSLCLGCINLASERANQIASRIDVLAEQLPRGQNRAQFALSDLLKDTGPTGFFRLPGGYQ